MKLRELKKKDAEYMYEWMHDKNVIKNLNTDFMSKTIQNCYEFIDVSKNNVGDFNLAIVDDSDEYMGTVSLKHIDEINSIAEFAITVRSCAMGKGFSRYAMKEIMRIGHDELKIKNIYWCVAKENVRAIKFYDKNGYKRIQDVPNKLQNMYSVELNKKLIWYCS
ncbi:GNAT family N-acetyltransferase [Clostridium sp. HCP1S3_B4]|uniref:GNAT family N-acetyltransferase n=1 Tax=unclassified Clostridium TaxID=2614128 RepID=UPI003F8869CB